MLQIPITPGMRQLSQEQEDMLENLFYRLSDSGKRICTVAALSGSEVTCTYAEGKFADCTIPPGVNDPEGFKAMLAGLPGFIGRLSPVLATGCNKIDYNLCIDAKSFGVSIEKTRYTGIPGFSGRIHEFSMAPFFNALGYKATVAVGLGFRMVACKVYRGDQFDPSTVFKDMSYVIACGAKISPDVLLSECRPPSATFDNFMEDIMGLVRRHGRGLLHGDKNVTALEFYEHV